LTSRWRAPQRGAWLVGAAAGAWLAFADYGAIWLWLPLWRDRGGLLLRLLMTLIPTGAALGALLAWLGERSWHYASRSPRPTHRWALLWAALAAPALHLLAVKLCSGGTMSRLRYHDGIELGLSLALPFGLYACLRLALRIAASIARGERDGTRVAAGLLALSFAFSKLNQSVLPNLYDYLHATLAVLAWCASALGLGLLTANMSRLAPLRAWAAQPRHTALAGAALSVTLVANLLTLDRNLNVRVAMFDPRTPASRAFLAAINPLLRQLDQRARTPPRRPNPQQRRQDVSGLPTRDGAHVLLVTIDALRADRLGAYGYGRPVSPGLDAFARQGWMFRRAYAQAPHSSYSLSSLHTSEYLHELVELGRPLPGATLATTLKEHGYHTAAFFTDGVFHTEGHKLATYRDGAYGFALFDHTNFEAQEHTDRVLAEVDRIREQGEPPSLLWVHYFDVHEPYQETTFGGGDSDRYDSEIKHVDRELTRLIAELDKRFERELVIAISADHGEEFREHGGVYHGSTLFDEQVRVPLFFRLPGAAPALVEAPVEVIDIAPTLLGMVGIAAPPSMRGRDLRALVAGRGPEQKPVFSAVLTKRMALRWPYKLIADLRFGLFELYDLERDPHERNNLARERPDKLSELRADVYGWLDSLEAAPTASAGEDARARALRWGRLGDRRAVEPMCALLLDAQAPTEMRVEAGQILAKLADESSAPALARALAAQPAQVAAEASIALGRMYDERARASLEKLVHVEDPYLRARAAVSLGRLRDVRAVPALIDALWVAPTLYEREEAVRWLGRLRDARAVEPLISVIPEFGMRYLVAVALGQIGDARAFDALADMLSWEERTNIRDEIVRGLGLLGDARAIDPLMAVLAREPGLKNSAESLVRLGALERGRLGGTDVGPALSGRGGLYGCQAGPLLHDWDYLERTSCMARGSAQLRMSLPAKQGASAGAQLLVRMKRDDAAEAVEVRFAIDGRPLPPRHVDGNWTEQRFELEREAIRGQRLELRISAADPAAVLVLDHALIVPHPSTSVAEVSVPAKAAHDAQHVR
jgi:arylsulfatase A-like enzyme